MLPLLYFQLFRPIFAFFFFARMKKGSRENFMTTKAKVNITYSIKTI